MSKSKKDAVGGHNTKPSGWEYMSRRPGSNSHGAYPCRWTKTLTHRIERRQAKRAIMKEC